MDVTRIDDNLLENAFYAVRKSRIHHDSQASIWNLSRQRSMILNKLHAGQYHLSPCQTYFYRRYMDDWIVFVKTRTQLRKVIKITYPVLKLLKFRMHLKNTFIGCIKKGFAFLGIQWNKVLQIAKKSIENHRHNGQSVMRKMLF